MSEWGRRLLLERTDMPQAPVTDDTEQAYLHGQRATILGLLRYCYRELGYDDPAIQHSRWLIERTEIINQLRLVCAEFGDNDWPDDLHLGDVIEKHLAPYLDRLKQAAGESEDTNE